ncbi:hypothetical protein ACRAWF_06145 [Streptomyces sp. L7]
MTTLAGYATVYRPEDMYIGTRLAALTALDSGITTMLDFSHNSRTRRTLRGGDRSPARHRVSGASTRSMAPHFGDWDRQWPADLDPSRGPVLQQRRPTPHPPPGDPGHRRDRRTRPLAYGPELARTAADLGIGVSVDAVFGEASSRAVLSWAEHGILGPDVTLIHATGLTAEAWKAMGESGTTVRAGAHLRRADRTGDRDPPPWTRRSPSASAPA